jgi:hypothetical protein
MNIQVPLEGFKRGEFIVICAHVSKAKSVISEGELE